MVTTPSVWDYRFPGNPFFVIFAIFAISLRFSPFSAFSISAHASTAQFRPAPDFAPLREQPPLPGSVSVYPSHLPYVLSPRNDPLPPCLPLFFCRFKIYGKGTSAIGVLYTIIFVLTSRFREKNAVCGFGISKAFLLTSI